MLARKARLVNELTCNLELSHTVSDTRASIEFQHTPFSEDDLYTIQSFYANRKLGDRTNEDTAQVAAILSNVLEALGVFDPLAQAVLVNHCSYCQYRREELIAVADSPATAFGLVLQGQCQAIEAGVQAGHPATLMRRRVLCPGACHRAGEEEQTLGPTLPPGSFFGIELCEAAPREILLWERSVMAIGACDVLSIEQGQLQALYKPPLLDIARRSKLLSKFPLFENETEHTMSALATSLVKTKVERNQVLLKQGSQCNQVLFINGKTQIRELREVSVELDGVKQHRVVELGSHRAPCMLNLRCVSAEARKGCVSTVLVSTPGTVYTLDRFTLMQSISTRGMKGVRDEAEAAVSDREIAEGYMQHVEWKEYKERLVEGIVHDAVQHSTFGQP
eukprot:TRINITY_DN6420_c0_g1_i4.p1 TRINITY_DN6420_c0_g1~~TRINITY_DN6420_c0_g1_i4.p1  ORF type:complete len:392 (+),score=95.12 TRINITY_DN6420_c0_g1_i4:236-1411(+)